MTKVAGILPVMHFDRPDLTPFQVLGIHVASICARLGVAPRGTLTTDGARSAIEDYPDALRWVLTP